MALPGGGTSINLTTEHENMKPGTLKLYLSTPEIEAAYNQLKDDELARLPMTYTVQGQASNGLVSMIQRATIG